MKVLGFLYQLKLEQVPHILFPIGDYNKQAVRQIAKENQLVVADKRDSMGICFIGQIDIKEFLAKRIGTKKGQVVLKDGTIIGEHDGYWFFTRGQRGGWRHNKIKNKLLPKLYVLDIKPDENLVVVGEREVGLSREFKLDNNYVFLDVMGKNAKKINSKWRIKHDNQGRTSTD